MRRALLIVIVAMAGCGPGDPRTCGPDGTGDDADQVAATLLVEGFADGVRSADGGATAFLYTPQHVDLGEEAIYVLCVGDVAIEGGPLYEPVLTDARAGVATRVGVSTTIANGVTSVEPGYLLGRIGDDDVIKLEVEWGDDFGESWSVAVEPGPFLIPVPAGVSVEARLHYRFLDADGELVWAQMGG